MHCDSLRNPFINPWRACGQAWWTPDLAPTKAITENISSTRRAFFSFGSMGVFQGHLNPLSSRSVVETCVMSVLLFGSESWYLSDTALDGLERFQGWIGKRILRLTRFHSNTTVHIGLDWPSMRARVLMRKLNYLRQLVGVSEDKLSSQIFHAFAGRDVSELTIIEQCRHLESVYEISFTSEILTSADSWASIQKRILSADRNSELIEPILVGLLSIFQPFTPRYRGSRFGIWFWIMGYKDLNLLSVFLEPSPIHSLETDLVLAVKPQYQRMLHI